VSRLGKTGVIRVFDLSSRDGDPETSPQKRKFTEMQRCSASFAFDLTGPNSPHDSKYTTLNDAGHNRTGVRIAEDVLRANA
jgi:hypothetical protein